MTTPICVAILLSISALVVVGIVLGVSYVANKRREKNG